MTQEEHNIQAACVRWFGYAHPELRGLLFAVPNGGARSKATAGRLKAEGVVAGVSDLILLVPRNTNPSIEEYGTVTLEIDGQIPEIWYHALCIEMKKKGGYQSPEQKEWQKKVEGHGYKYAVCRSLDEFIDTVEAYLR
jgi:hypothetical protein